MRKLLLVLAMLCFFALPAEAQFTRVGADNETCVTSTTCQPATAVMAQSGDLLVMYIGIRNIGSTLSGVSDATNGAWTCPAGLDIQSGAVPQAAICYFINSGAASIAPTATIAAANTIYVLFEVWRPTGTVTIDQTSETTTAAGTSHAGTQISTGANARLVVAMGAHTGNITCTSTSGMTLGGNEARSCFFYDITSTQSTTHDAAYTTLESQGAGVLVASFNDSGAAAGVAFDACSESHAATTASNNEASFSWTHTPVGTPRGVVVWVFELDSSTDFTGSVTYDGEAVAAVTSGAIANATAEPSYTKVYFLGSGVNTGAVTVVVNRTNNAVTMYAIACTVTASTDTETTGVVTTANVNTDVVNEESITDGSPGTDSLRFGGVFLGYATLPAVGANSTAGPIIDIGGNGAGVAYETTAGQGARSVGFSDATPDENSGVYLAIKEASAGGAATIMRLMLMGIGGN